MTEDAKLAKSGQSHVDALGGTHTTIVLKAEQASAIGDVEDFLKLFTDTLNYIQAAKADGKIDYSDLGGVIALFPSVMAAIKGADQVPGELSNMSTDDKSRFKAGIKQVINGVLDAVMG